MESSTANIERFVRHIVDNRQAFERYRCHAQAVVGAALILLGAGMGSVHFHLIVAGARTSGRIVGSKAEVFSDNSGDHHGSHIGYLPVVEFDVHLQPVEFTDWLAENTTPVNGTRVEVLYDPVDPSRAMIDHAGLNWIPWAPILGVGAFLVLVALKGWLASRRPIAC